MTLETIRVPVYGEVRETISSYLNSSSGVGVNHLWFWTDGWQALEAEADADIAEGRYKTFDNMDEFIATLGS